jgi:ligand-binding sensor domain-containing protein
MADLNKTLQDAAYITIGLGVIAFQRAQVQRQEIKKQLEAQLGEAKGGFSKLSGTVEDRVKALEERFEGVQKQVEASLSEIEANVDKAVDELATRLPEPARDALNTARNAARDARTQLRARVA